MTSLKGNLSAVDLANIFQMLSMNQREGTLWIFDGQSRKAIYFGADGVSMLTRGKHKPDALGRILIRCDKVTPEQLEEALRLQTDSGGRLLGQVLVEQGMVTRADVEEALRTQIEEEVYSLFIWKDAQFEFVEGPPDDEVKGGEGVTRLTFNVNSLIMEAAKRVDEWEWIQKVIPATDEIFRYTGRNVALEDEIFAQHFAGKVLAAVDGKRSVDEIIGASCVNRFEVTKMLALLLEGGAIETLPVPELRRAAQDALAAGDTDQTVKFLTRLVALKGDTPDMHRQLAEVFESRRLLERAAFHYKVYAEILADSGDRAKAFETYRRICDFLPTDVAAADRMLEIFASNPDGLEEHAVDMIARGKLLAEIYGELGRQSRAIQVLHRVVALGPDDQDLRQRLIQVYLQSGMQGEAVTEYEALAETALAIRDYDQAEKIYRKILQIDRGREEAQARLNQLLSKRRLRQRGIRLGIAGAVFLVVGSFAGFRGWQWYQEQNELAVANAAAFNTRLGELRRTHLPLEEELDQAAKQLAGAFRDATSMAEELKRGAAQRKDAVARANAAVQSFHSLAGEYPAVAETGEATDAAQSVAKHASAVVLHEEKLRQALTRAVDDLFDKVEPFPPPMPLAELDGVLREINRLAEAVPQWHGGEKGAKAQAYAKNVADTLAAFQSVEKDVAELRARNDVTGAQERIIEYLAGDSANSSLLSRIEFPRTVVTRPEGARVVVDDEETGLVTPAVVSVPLTRKFTLKLVKDGFETASTEVPALERIDRRTLHEDLRLAFEEVLHKDLLFRTTALPAKVVASPAIAGDRLIVPTKGADAGVFDLAGTARGTLPTKSATGVQVRPAVIGEHVVLASYDGTLFHFLASGDACARESLPGKIQADPVEWRDFAIFADIDGHVTAYDVVARRKAWTYPQGGPGRAQGFRTAPVIVEGELFVLGADSRLYVLDPQTGAEKRASKLLKDGAALAVVTSGVAGSGDSLFVACRADRGQTRLLSVDRQTLEVRSGVTIEGNVRSTPLAWQGFAYVVTDEGVIWSVRAGEGNLQGAQSMRLGPGVRVAAEPALDQGVLYVGDVSGTLWAVDVRGAQPQQLYDFRIPGSDKRPVRILTRPVVTESYVVFAAEDNAVYCLRK